MSVIKSVSTARERGASDFDILNNIYQQNPKKRAVIDSAKKRGASSTQIINEFVKQNTKTLQTSQRGVNGASPKKEEKSLLRKGFDFFTDNVQNFGQTLGDAVAAPFVAHQLRGEEKKQADLSQRLRTKLSGQDVEQKKRGLNVLQNIESAGGGSANIEDIVPSYGKTKRQIFGEGLGVALDIASFGRYGQAAKAAKTGNLLTGSSKIAKRAKQLNLPVVFEFAQKSKPIASTIKRAAVKGALKEGVEGAVVGGGFGASEALKDGASAPEVFSRAVKGALVSGGISAFLGARAGTAPFRSKKIREKAVNQYTKGLRATKEKMKEKTSKLVPKLLDENISGTANSLLKKAKKGVLLADDEYAKLGKLKGIADADGIVESIADTITSLKKTGASINKSKIKTLQGLSDDILSLKVYDEALEKPVVYKQHLRELKAVYDSQTYATRKAIRTVEESKTLSQVKKVSDLIRKELNSTTPEYERINKINHLNSSLKEVLEETFKRDDNKSWLSLVEAVAGSGGATAGGIIGASARGLSGGVIAAIATGSMVAGLSKLLRSAWWNTTSAVRKNKVAKKLASKSYDEAVRWILLISSRGEVAVDRLLNENDSEELQSQELQSQEIMQRRGSEARMDQTLRLNQAPPLVEGLQQTRL